MNELSTLDSFLKLDQLTNTTITDYEKLILLITPKTVKLPELLDYACTISTYTHSELLLQILMNYLPGYSSNTNDDYSFIHLIDKETRVKGHQLLNQALNYCQKKIKSQSKSMNCPIINTLMSLCLISSGLADDLGLSYSISDIESSIGFLPVHELENYDDDFDLDPEASDFATASFLRVLSFIMVFFDTDVLSKFLNKLTVKKNNNAYDLENLWISNSEQLNEWLTKNNAELLVSLLNFFKTHSIITDQYTLKMTAYFPKIPTTID